MAIGSLLLLLLAVLVAEGLSVRPEREEAAEATVSGREQIVFDWSRDACEANDIPDLPARAFRDAAGNVQLIVSHFVNRRMVGRTMDRLRHTCQPVMRSTRDARPWRFNDREWVASTYTADGRAVVALVHNEYQGHRHRGRCPQRRYRACWYNAITLAQSDDGGRSYRQRAAPSHLLASPPYRYRAGAGPFGLFSPSNIVRKGGYYYALVLALEHRAQQRGTCLLRTRRLADPDAWRAWDGERFSVRFIDPYAADDVGPRRHVCAPVSHDQIQEMVASLTYNTYLKRWVLVGQTVGRVWGRPKPVWGIYFSTSKDLVNWTDRKLLMEAEVRPSWRCGDQDPIAYPSLLDPGSSSRNFVTTGRRPYLYFTRIHYRSCRQTLNRDLVRVRVEFST